MLPRIHTLSTESPRSTVTTVRQDRTRALVSATGEWDLGNSAQLGAMLEAHERAGRRFVRLDVSGVTFLDCACLDVLVAAHGRLLAARGTLVLTGVPTRLARLLRIARLDDVLLTTSVSDTEIQAERWTSRSRTPVVRPLVRPA